jgi:hypothetical protein
VQDYIHGRSHVITLRRRARAPADLNAFITIDEAGERKRDLLALARRVEPVVGRLPGPALTALAAMSTTAG